MFFSVKHEVPIIAIFTKFDLLVEDQLQDLMENVEDSDDVDEEELERQAVKITTGKFESHYKNVLLEKPFPPQAVVAVSNIHTSTPRDSRFGELLNATSKALNIKTNDLDTQLSSLFASAQMADLQFKFMASVTVGMPRFITVGAEREAAEVRDRCLRVITAWNTGIENPETIFLPFQSNVENHPQTFCNESSLNVPRMIGLTSLQQEACRRLQLVADLTVIMAEIFLLRVEHEPDVRKIVQDYPNTPAFAFIQKSILQADWTLSYEGMSLFYFGQSWNNRIMGIIAEAVALNARG